MDILTALAVGVFIAHAAGYTLYIRGTIRNDIAPNMTSWTTWVLGNIANALTYWFGTDGDLAKNVLPLTCLIGSIVTWTVANQHGKFKRLDRWGWSVVFCELFALFVWAQFQEALWANIFIQVSTVISFIPITLGAWHRSEVERPKPWFWWSLAYGLDTILIAMSVQEWEEFAYPVTCLFMHLMVGIIALRHHHAIHSLAKS